MKLHYRQLLREVCRLMDPRNIETFFKEMRIKPAKEVFNYLLILGLLTFIGYIIRYGFFSEPNYLEIAVKISLLYYLVGIYVPIGILPLLLMSYFFHWAGEKLVKKEVSLDEAANIIGYAAVPGLIGGLFGILLETQILHILLISYSVYLLYSGLQIRYGFEFSLRAFMFIIFSGFICSTLLFVLGAVLLGIPGQYYGRG